MSEIAVVGKMVHRCELHTIQFEIIILWSCLNVRYCSFSSLPSAATADRATERQGIMLMYFPVCRLLRLLSARVSDSESSRVEHAILHDEQGHFNATQSAGRTRSPA